VKFRRASILPPLMVIDVSKPQNRSIGLAAAAMILAWGGAAHATQAQYACSGGTQLTAKFSPPNKAKGQVVLTFAEGRKVTLPQAMSADGGRYANKTMEFWIKGRDATLTRNGTSESCSSP